MSLYKDISQLYPYIISIRKLKTYLSFDISFPNTWKLPKKYVPENSAVEIESAQPNERSISFVSEFNEEAVDKTTLNIVRIIQYNKEREEKERLLQDKVNELKNIFEKQDLTTLKSLQFNLNKINKLELSERLKSRKNITKILVSNTTVVKESINIPLKSMISIGNQTLRNYVDTLDESSKKEFIQLMSEDVKSLEEKFETIRESAISKLNLLLEKEQEDELKTKLSDTIDRLTTEKFDQLSFLKLKQLESSI
jgi:hypothetical protein